MTESDSTEIVPPSSEPQAAVSTGSGREPSGATPPPDPQQSAGTGGIGTQADQQGASAQGGAPYRLSGDDDTEPRSDSGT